MKIRVDAHEVYPAFELETDPRFGREVEVPDDFMERFEQARKAYVDVQDLLEIAWNKAGRR